MQSRPVRPVQLPVRLGTRMGKSGLPSIHVEMIDNLTEEERAALEAQCDLWQAEAIAAQDAEMSSGNLKTEVVSD